MRPTSETVVNSFFAKWVQSYRDLPLLLNQWANVVRWELRPRLFLRTSEFLWQEGHTAHATEDDAREYALGSWATCTGRPWKRCWRCRSWRGARRPGSASPAPSAPGPGGDDGRWKALQMGTSHELGQNFARAFGIQFSSETGTQEYVWQTSWGGRPAWSGR